MEIEWKRVAAWAMLVERSLIFGREAAEEAVGTSIVVGKVKGANWI
jgi:hypothetical protein